MQSFIGARHRVTRLNTSRLKSSHVFIWTQNKTDPLLYWSIFSVLCFQAEDLLNIYCFLLRSDVSTGPESSASCRVRKCTQIHHHTSHSENIPNICSVCVKRKGWCCRSCCVWLASSWRMQTDWKDWLSGEVCRSKPERHAVMRWRPAANEEEIDRCVEIVKIWKKKNPQELMQPLFASVFIKCLHHHSDICGAC